MGQITLADLPKVNALVREREHLLQRIKMLASNSSNLKVAYQNSAWIIFSPKAKTLALEEQKEHLAKNARQLHDLGVTVPEYP